MEYSDEYLPSQPRVELAALVALAFILFIGLNLFLDRNEPGATQAARAASAAQTQPAMQDNPALIAPPYNKYVVTQGPHGASYGHLAIDLAAGRGKPIKSPISGVISEKYTDPYGNPTLVIENEVYIVTLLHGKYTVSRGQRVKLGEVVGTESNKGYTTDMQGNPCRQRQCGYHTHLNVYDKRVQANINPLTLFEQEQADVP